MHPDDECRPESITQANLEAMRKMPPPLQPGDAVWVRAVVSKVDDVGRNRKRVEVDMAHVSSAGLLTSQVVCGVPLTAIRRIEGEVKP